MIKRTQNLAILAGIVFALLLVLRIVPMLYNYYQRGQEDIALLQERRDRYQQLVIDVDRWKENEILKQAEIADLESWIFEGTNPNLVGSSVQRSLRQAVEQAKVETREMKVAQYNYIDNWLMVSQEMDFSIDQTNILPFLNALQELRPRLHVSALTVTRNRRQYTGTITVVGFSRAEREQ
ncbi:MAG: GspMb/PilO family protein [Pseudomonadota bacterium]